MRVSLCFFQKKLAAEDEKQEKMTVLLIKQNNEVQRTSSIAAITKCWAISSRNIVDNRMREKIERERERERERES